MMQKTFDGLLMAGGRSRRMGRPKGMLEFNGKPWICHQVELLGRLKESGMRRIVVVVGEHSEVYRKALAGVSDKVQFIFNADFDAPQFASLQLGLNALAVDAPDWVWVQPLDSIVPSHDVSYKLISALEKPSDQMRVVRPQFGDRFGHPVLLAKSFCEELMAVLPGDPRARLDHQIKSQASEATETVTVEDESVLLNLNTPEQWQAYVDATKS